MQSPFPTASDVILVTKVRGIQKNFGKKVGSCVRLGSPRTSAARQVSTARVDNIISYLNTDLDLASAEDLHPLVDALQSAALFALSVTLGQDGRWYATLETEADHAEPETNIDSMLAAIEALDVVNRKRWDECTLREFNIGYDCGAEPWAFNQGLSPNLLGRMAAARAALRITLYPDRPIPRE